MFISALGAVTGHSNRLGLKRVSRAVVILVDGLGAENIRAAAGHAPFLNAALRENKSINTVFPSTTAAAITSFGTGASPSESGIFGYSVYDRAGALTRNMLSGWDDTFIPGKYQRLTSIADQARAAGVRSYTVGPGEYAETGFTALNMSGASYIPAKSFAERADATIKIVKAKAESLTYVYFPELDAAAHAFGAASQTWLNLIEDLDSTIRNLINALPTDVGLLVTADHGIIDVPKEKQVLLDEIDIPNLIAVTGDPRNCFLYFSPGAHVEESKRLLETQLAGAGFVATVQDLQRGAWLSSQISNPEFLPDLFLIAHSDRAFYHRAYAKPQSLRMIGQHGGISSAELSVPLLKLAGFAL